MAFKMKGSAFKLGNVATKSAMKSPLEQNATQFGYHDEEGNVIASEETGNTGRGSMGTVPSDYTNENEEYNEKVGKYIRQQAMGGDLTDRQRNRISRQADRLKKKRLKEYNSWFK